MVRNFIITRRCVASVTHFKTSFEYNFKLICLLQSLCCYGSQLCTIPKDGNYFYWENRCLLQNPNIFGLSYFARGTGPSQFYGEYTLCEKCMEGMEGEVLIGDDPNQPQM